MKRCISTFLFFITIATTIFGQTRQVDSISFLIRTSNSLDTTRVQNLYRLCFLLRNLDPKKAIKYGNQSLELARNLGYKKGEAAAFNNLGAVYDNIGKTKEALNYFFKAYEIKKNIGDRKGLSSSLNNIGVIYKREGNYVEALKYYSLAKEYAVTSKYLDAIVGIQANIGVLYKEMNNWDSANYYLKGAIPIATANPEWLVDIYTHLCGLYSNARQFQKSICYADTGLIFYHKIEGVKPYNYLLMLKAVAYEKSEQTDSAFKYFELARLQLKDTTDYEKVQALYTRLSDFNFKLYKIKKNNFDLLNAFTYLKISVHAKDVLANQNKSQIINNLARQIEVHELESEIQSTLKEKEISDLKVKRQAIIIYFSAILLVLIVLLSILLYKRYVIKKKLNIELNQKIILQQKEQLTKLQLAQFQNEIKLLRAQINPHFLFNSLNNIYSYAVQKKDETPDLILKLSEILRFLSETKLDESYGGSMKELSIIKQLIELYLVNKRWNNKINFLIDEKLLKNDFKIEPHSFLTLVENCFKHTNLDENGSFIDIKIKMDNGIRANISNKVRQNKSFSNSGIGIENLTKRLEITYKNTFNYKFEEKNGIYYCDLYLPFL
jgi:TPR repeat protein